MYLCTDTIQMQNNHVNVGKGTLVNKVGCKNVNIFGGSPPSINNTEYPPTTTHYYAFTTNSSTPLTTSNHLASNNTWFEPNGSTSIPKSIHMGTGINYGHNINIFSNDDDQTHHDHSHLAMNDGINYNCYNKK